MTTEQLLYLDYRKDENKKMIQKALKKIKPFSEFEKKPTIEDFEKYIGKVSKKYNVVSQYIMFHMDDDGNILPAISFKSRIEHEWIATISGCCLYEVFAKSIICLYTKIKKGEISKL